MKKYATINLDPVLRSLSRLERENLPFAEAMALNETAFQAKDALVAQMPQKFDLRSNRPKKGFRVKKAAKKQALRESSVTHLDDWMGIHETGGTKQKKLGNGDMGIPMGAVTSALAKGGKGTIRETMYPRNLLKYKGSNNPKEAGKQGGRGNKQPGRAKAFVLQDAQGDKFIVSRKRKKDGREGPLNWYYSLHEKVNVKPRWDFFKTVRGVAKSKLAKNFKSQLTKAVQMSKKP